MRYPDPAYFLPIPVELRNFERKALRSGVRRDDKCIDPGVESIRPSSEDIFLKDGFTMA
jgi:hypothetical protein